MSTKELSPMENGRVWGIVYHDGKFHILPGGIKTISRNFVQGPWGHDEILNERVDGFQKMPKVVREILISEWNHTQTDGTHTKESEGNQSFLPLQNSLQGDILSDVLVLSVETVSFSPEMVYEEGLLKIDPKFPTTPEDLEGIHADALLLIYYADRYPRELWPIKIRNSDDPEDPSLFEFS